MNASPPTEPPRSEHRHTKARDEFEREVLEGLTSAEKSLPCKYFYDTRGSQLFEQICETPEYYVTRTELDLLRKVAPEVTSLIGPSADVLEPGSGAGEKIRILLDALDSPRSFIPIDISKSAVEASAAALKQSYSKLEVFPIVADFTQPFELPENFKQRTPHRKVIFFPGSTISNFAPEQAKRFLEQLRSVLATNDFLFIGVDRIKDKSRLEAAYDDSQGITAAFNLNLLERISRELETDLDPAAFAHRAVYNESESRIEMHLVSQKKHSVSICERTVHFEEGEFIHTENSYKYSVAGFTELAQQAGFDVDRTYSDDEDLFSLYLCSVPAES